MDKKKNSIKEFIKRLEYYDYHRFGRSDLYVIAKALRNTYLPKIRRLYAKDTNESTNQRIDGNGNKRRTKETP